MLSAVHQTIPTAATTGRDTAVVSSVVVMVFMTIGLGGRMLIRTHIATDPQRGIGHWQPRFHCGRGWSDTDLTVGLRDRSMMMVTLRAGHHADRDRTGHHGVGAKQDQCPSEAGNLLGMTLSGPRQRRAHDDVALHQQNTDAGRPDSFGLTG